MRMTRVPLLILALLLGPAAAAHAAPADPWVAYAANSVVTKQGQPSAVVLRVDPATGALTEISRNGAQGNLFRRPYDIAVAPGGGSLYVVDMGEFATVTPAADGRLIRVDPATGAQSLVAEGGGLVDPAGLTVAPDGSIFVIENVGADGNPAVIRIDPASGAQTVVTSGQQLCYPFGIALEPSGSLVVTDFGSFRTDLSAPCPRIYGSVLRVNPGTGGQGLLSTNVLGLGNLLLNPFGVTVAPDGRIMVVNQRGGEGAVTGIDLVSGIQTAITPNSDSDRLVTPQRLALAPDGRLVVSDFALDDQEGGLVTVSPADGAQQVLRRGTDLFNNPLGVAVLVNRAPVAALAAAPGLVAGGKPISFDAGVSSDPEGLPLRYDWDLDGDGLFELRGATSPRASRRFSSSTTFTPRVRVTDPHGAQAVAAAGAALVVDAIRPVVSSFGASPRRLAARGSSRRSGASAPRPARSLRFRFRLSEGGTLRISLQRALPGRRKGRRCLAPLRSLRRAKRCTRWRELTALRRKVRAGPGRVRFSGKVRGRALQAGRYRAVAVAVDRVGNRSRPRQVTLRAVRVRR